MHILMLTMTRWTLQFSCIKLSARHETEMALFSYALSSGMLS